jgi:predicted SnoaL-like aldol condensation-catalyzing enzyme
MADNAQIVLNAFETLFNKWDYAAAERFWSPNYIQHSAHIPPGREGLFALIKGTPEALHYENELTVANGHYVLLHGRFSGLGLPANWIVVDIVRLENGQLAEHWDVIQDEATREQSRSGLPMFGDRFPAWAHEARRHARSLFGAASGRRRSLVVTESFDGGRDRLRQTAQCLPAPIRFSSAS